MIEGEITREQVLAVLAAIFVRLEGIHSFNDIGNALLPEPLIEVLVEAGWDVKEN